MPIHTCPTCDKEFADKSNYNRHLFRKTSCAPILDKEDLPEAQKNNPHKCKFCGRAFSSKPHLLTHMRRVCKIAPREGNPDGMDKLYEYVLRKQRLENAKLKARLEALEAHIGSGARAAVAVETKNPEEQKELQLPAKEDGARDVLGVGHPIQALIINQGINANTITMNTVNNISINLFERENINRITKPQIFDILRGLGPLGENIQAQAEKAIIQTAMLIFSDPTHPEDITCYLPNKKGDNALVHGEFGWEMQPIGLVISPMAAQSIEALFKHQPAPDTTTPANDVKWMMGECTRMMRYIADHEGAMTVNPPKGEMRGILIRNRDLLQQVLAKLPIAGAK